MIRAFGDVFKSAAAKTLYLKAKAACFAVGEKGLGVQIFTVKLVKCVHYDALLAFKSGAFSPQNHVNS